MKVIYLLLLIQLPLVCSCQGKQSNANSAVKDTSVNAESFTQQSDTLTYQEQLIEEYSKIGKKDTVYNDFDYASKDSLIVKKDFLVYLKQICEEENVVLYGCDNPWNEDGSHSVFFIQPKVGTNKWIQNKRLKFPQLSNLDDLEFTNLLKDRINFSDKKIFCKEFDIWVLYVAPEYLIKVNGMDDPYNFKDIRKEELYHLVSDTMTWQRFKVFDINKDDDYFKYELKWFEQFKKYKIQQLNKE